MTRTRRWLIVGCLLCLPIGATAEPEGLQVQHAWSRPAMAGHTGIIYLTITAHGAADRLIDAHSPVAAKTELHETINDHGIMKMRGVRSLPIPADQTVTLKPGGYHIMLMGLKHALHAGDSVPVTLTFAKAGKRVAVAMVEGPGAGEMQSSGMTMHH